MISNISYTYDFAGTETVRYFLLGIYCSLTDKINFIPEFLIKLTNTLNNII